MPIKSRYSLRYVQNPYIWLPLLHLTPPPEGFHWDDLHKIFDGRQRMAKVPTKQQQPFYGPLSWITRVSLYQKKHSPTHHSDHHPIFINFFHLPGSIASSLFKLHAWQSFCTTSLHILFGLPVGQEPSTSYSKHFFTQSVSSFRSTCPYHRNLFCGSINIVSSLSTLYQMV